MALRIPNVCPDMMSESYVVLFRFIIEDGLCMLLGGMVMESSSAAGQKAGLAAEQDQHNEEHR